MVISFSFLAICILLLMGSWIQDWREKREAQFRRIAEFSGHAKVKTFLKGGQ